MSKNKRLRELIAKGAVIMPGVPNAAMARQAERAGFDAVYVSGAGMANATAGVPDIGLLTLSEVAQLAGYIAKAIDIPAIVDADTGLAAQKMRHGQFVNSKAPAWRAVTLKIRNFRSAVAILPGNRLWISRRWSEKSKQRSRRVETRIS